MKKTVLKVCTFLLFSIILLSCNNDDTEKDNTKIKVDLKVVTSGTVSNSPTLEYRSSNGEIVTEVLTSPNIWTKSFNVQQGFKLYVKAKGTVEGVVSMEASATGDGVNYKGDNQIAFRSPSSFELEITKDL